MKQLRVRPGAGDRWDWRPLHGRSESAAPSRARPGPRTTPATPGSPATRRASSQLSGSGSTMARRSGSQALRLRSDLGRLHARGGVVGEPGEFPMPPTVSFRRVCDSLFLEASSPTDPTPCGAPSGRGRTKRWRAIDEPHAGPPLMALDDLFLRAQGVIDRLVRRLRLGPRPCCRPAPASRRADRRSLARRARSGTGPRRDAVPPPPARSRRAPAHADDAWACRRPPRPSRWR